MADNPNHQRLGEIHRLVPSQSLAAQGADALRAMVLGGVLLPGQRLNEVELSAALGISRAPLREAIRHLASQGLLTILTHKGAFVPCYTAEDLRDIYEVRVALESHAARLVAERRSLADLGGLATLLEEADAALEEGVASAYPVTLDFHRELVRLAGNVHLEDAAVSVDQKLQLARLRSGHSPVRARDALDEHRQILGCLMTRDAAGAAALLAQHLHKSLANALSIENGVVGAPIESDEAEHDAANGAI
jgi:DNA-binding GntR family transcriptional regulator